MTKGAKESYRYLPVSERDRRWGFFAYGGGHAGGGGARSWLAFGGGCADHLLRRGVLSRRQIVYHICRSERELLPYHRALGILQSSPVGIQQALAGKVLEILGAASSTGEQN